MLVSESCKYAGRECKHQLTKAPAFLIVPPKGICVKTWKEGNLDESTFSSCRDVQGSFPEELSQAPNLIVMRMDNNNLR
jgi:hypothetical protein